MITGSGSLVVVIDDDPSVRESLPDLVRAFGFSSQAFSSAEEFLASDVAAQARCLILDIDMPGTFPIGEADQQQEGTLERRLKQRTKHVLLEAANSL
jgi:FixJ family two-component response regulator